MGIQCITPGYKHMYWFEFDKPVVIILVKLLWYFMIVKFRIERKNVATNQKTVFENKQCLLLNVIDC